MKYTLREGEGLPSSILWLMTIGAGLVVANLYYNQPLLGMMGREFNISESKANLISMFTQVGYAVGLLFIVPLGDKFKRRPVLAFDFLLLVLALLGIAVSPTIGIALFASLFIGICSVVPQMFVPIAAQLSTPETKGKNIGIVMSGLLTGILASRVISGLVGQYWGWREMYYIVVVLMVGYGLLVVWKLPDIKPTFKGTYVGLMKSIVFYARTQPVLRLSAIRGALAFSAFLAFWTTLVFHLERAPFYAGSDIAGTLGLLGIGGALIASVAGRFSHKLGENNIISAGLLLMFSGWLICWVGGYSYIGLIIGIVLLDMGMQCVQISNQVIIYSLCPEATNRVNTVFMTTYFIGGALGTFIAGKAWQYFAWEGVAASGLLILTTALVIHWSFSPKFVQGHRVKR
ncbi:MFS transporter [uncultured Bacteroides sp.]|uniref:MFS transporter n=1 Tax=uncultured Bacteroides sp. TaxID=162156 RepID=UPI002AA81BEC|nr:MFS transporter [uncultured Bacteroides sp.]